MTVYANLIFQIFAMIAQFGNFASGIVPPNWRMYVALLVGLAQSLVAWRAQHVNPDGTPAELAYKKET